MPASSFSRDSQTGDSGTEAFALKCKSCGAMLAVPRGLDQEATGRLIDAESARCARLREIAQQREALGARIQAGIAGMLGSDRIDTNDLVAQRMSLAQLAATLTAEAEDLAKFMVHLPERP
jgi:hypothetical protein